MSSEELICVTIITEAILELQLVEQLRQVGARGYMISNVRGESWRGIRPAEWTEAHIRIETIADQAVADRIEDLLAHNYLPHYAIMSYQSRVTVARSDPSLPRPRP